MHPYYAQRARKLSDGLGPKACLVAKAERCLRIVPSEKNDVLYHHVKGRFGKRSDKDDNVSSIMLAIIFALESQSPSTER